MAETAAIKAEGVAGDTLIMTMEGLVPAAELSATGGQIVHGARAGL